MRYMLLTGDKITWQPGEIINGKPVEDHIAAANYYGTAFRDGWDGGNGNIVNAFRSACALTKNKVIVASIGDNMYRLGYSGDGPSIYAEMSGTLWGKVELPKDVGIWFDVDHSRPSKYIIGGSLDLRTYNWNYSTVLSFYAGDINGEVKKFSFETVYVYTGEISV